MSNNRLNNAQRGERATSSNNIITNRAVPSTSVNDLTKNLDSLKIDLSNIRKRELNDIFLKNSNINNKNRLLNYKEYDVLANKILELIKKISKKFVRHSNITKPIYDIYRQTTGNNNKFQPPQTNNNKLESIKVHANKSGNPVYEKAADTLRRIRYLLEVFKKENITNSNKIKLFMNYTHPSKKRNTTTVGRKIFYVPTINKRIEELLTLNNSTSNIFFTKIIETLYAVISETISNLHMMKEHIKKVYTSKSKNYQYNDNGLKLLKMNLTGKKTIRIHLNEVQTKIFFKRMFYDMVHDELIQTKKEFIEILEVFVNKTSNTSNILNYLNDVPEKLIKQHADKAIKDEKKNNRNGYCHRSINQNFVTRNKQFLYKHDLIKFMKQNGSKKYKKFDVVMDTDARGVLTQSILKLSQTTQSGIGKGSILITPSTLLDPGSYHMSREGFNPLISMSRAFISKNNGHEHLFRLNGRMYDTELTFANLGKTTISYYYNPSRGYQLILNNNKTLNFGITRKKAAKANAPVHSKISKFLGDFMIIMNTIGINQDKETTRPTVFSTLDNSAALIYIFMSELAKVKARLIFTTANELATEMCMYGMNDIIIGQRGNRRTSTNRLSNTIKNTNLGNASNTNN